MRIRLVEQMRPSRACSLSADRARTRARDTVFRIRFFTPSVPDDRGWPHAGGELQLGPHHLRFLVDLRHWSITEYEAQWRAGVARLVVERQPTALLTGYRGATQDPHVMWALWPEGDSVYVQELTVLPAEIDDTFDPRQAHRYVGERIPASEQGLPIPEYRLDLLPLLAAHYLPNFPWRWMAA
jgi:hypothetical protein